MNYELAKELKEAGYLQEKMDIVGNHRICPDGTFTCYGQHTDTPCYSPTLSELIEACLVFSEEKNGDFHLEKNEKSSWGASIDCFKNDPYIFGKTPEEAVARLWLSLNKP